MSVFSDILVSKVSEEVLPDWTVRTLKVEKVLRHIKLLYICRSFDACQSVSHTIFFNLVRHFCFGLYVFTLFVPSVG